MDSPTITAAALETLDGTGLEKLTMRAVADRLGVRVGGLYYHLPDKAALLRSMADVLCRRVLDGLAPDGSVLEFCVCLRESLRGHRDGARLLASAPMNGSVGALALMEHLIGLVEAGVTADRANTAADTLMSYVTGFVLQEQVQAGVAGPPPGIGPQEIAERFPRTVRGFAEDDEQVFRTAVDAIVRGFLAAR